MTPLTSRQYLLAGLIAAELLSMAVMRWTVSLQKAVLDRHLGGRSLENLDEAQRAALDALVNLEFDGTVQRKVQVLIIAYHLPALASWTMLTRRTTIPPIWTSVATLAFWYAVACGANLLLIRWHGK